MPLGVAAAGRNPAALKAAGRRQFRTAVEDFLGDCRERGVPPEKPASGKLMLRVPPEVHGAALVAARAAGKSLNQWATEVLQRAADSRLSS